MPFDIHGHQRHFQSDGDVGVWTLANEGIEKTLREFLDLLVRHAVRLARTCAFAILEDERQESETHLQFINCEPGDLRNLEDVFRLEDRVSP